MRVEKIILILLLTAVTQLGCGVKGDPLPPQRPAELGRGRPTYRRATQRIKVQPQVEPADEEDKEEEAE